MMIRAIAGSGLRLWGLPFCNAYGAYDLTFLDLWSEDQDLAKQALAGVQCLDLRVSTNAVDFEKYGELSQNLGDFKSFMNPAVFDERYERFFDSTFSAAYWPQLEYLSFWHLCLPESGLVELILRHGATLKSFNLIFCFQSSGTWYNVFLRHAWEGRTTFLHCILLRLRGQAGNVS